MKKFVLISFLIIPAFCICQQDPEIKFGKISARDLAVKSYELDSLADAVVLADIGSIQFRENQKGWFSLEFRRHKRIHILRKNGFKYADVTIRLHKEGDDEERLSDVKGATYYLEDGKIISRKLDAINSVFTDKLDKNNILKKFTLPSIDEGSIVEFEYKITSDFLFSLRPWIFQEDVPVLWSEYKADIPYFFNYILVGQGGQAFYKREMTQRQGLFTVESSPVGSNLYAVPNIDPERITFSCLINQYRWAMKDVPPLHEEQYVTSLKNYLSKLEFQLSGFNEPFQESKLLRTWLALSKDLLQKEDFGQEISKPGSWLSDVVQPIINGANTDVEKAYKIFSFIRDNFSCINYDQRFVETSLKKVYEERKGGIAEINLLLTAMLRKAGINAEPVMLSTRDNGIIYSRYPMVARFNYVITKAVADGKEFFLDAGVKNLGFGKLDYRCYNGDVLIVNESAPLIPFRPDELTEATTTDIKLAYDNTGNWKAQGKKLFGYYQSLEFRKQNSKEGKEGLSKLISNAFDNNITIENLQLDSLFRTEDPIMARFDLLFKEDQPGIIYLNPVMGEDFRQNPFKSTLRQYPVELPYRISNTYTCTLTVPDGYRADEVPKPLIVNILGGGGVLDYSVKQSGKDIKITYKLEISKTIFQPSEYNDLRDFFTKVVAKKSEQIVLKKN